MENNKGFSAKEIQKLKEKLASSGKSYEVIPSEDNSDDFMNFHFIGNYEDQPVIYDAAIYTLKLQHSSEIYDLAEHKVAQKFPKFRKIAFQEDENGDIMPLDDLDEEIGLYLTEVMDELEEDDVVKVQEHVDVDPNIDFGVGLDIGLHKDKIDHEVIERFIKDFNAGKLKLDPTHYSFQFDEEED